MGVKLYCWSGLALYALLSAADLALTASLLRVNVEAYESNPVAAACLDRYGWQGLTLFKAGAVVVVVGAVGLLVRRQPVAAGAVVTFGCLVLLSVTTYSHGLLRQTHRDIEQGNYVPRSQLPQAGAGQVRGIPEQFWLATR